MKGLIMVQNIKGNNLERLNGETDLQYHKRLINGKLVDKTLADYDFSELSKYVYGREYAPDVARRMMYGSKRTIDMFENATDDDTVYGVSVAEIEQKKKELQMERQRFFDQRRELNKIISTDGRLEHLCETIRESAKSLCDTLPLEREHESCAIGSKYREAVLVFSDWHFGLKTSNIYNTYDTEECQRRVDYIVNAAKQRIIEQQCNKLHIVILGDMIHGAIHVSARVASEELVCDQLIKVSEIIAQAISSLADCVDETYVHATYGNHARTVASKEDNIHRDNMERLIPWWLTERLYNREDIIFCNEVNETEFMMFSSCGKHFCATHGDLDTVRSSTRLLPVLFQKTVGVMPDYILLGDKHHEESFEELGIKSMLCGSLCGTDDYANTKRLYSTPSQLLLIVDECVGVDAKYEIEC